MRDILVGVCNPFLIHSACEEEDEGDECDGEEGFEERVEEVELRGGRERMSTTSRSEPGHEVMSGIPGIMSYGPAGESIEGRKSRATRDRS